MEKFIESYRKIDDPVDSFDIDFWQKQGPEAIFEAALEMIRDYQLIRKGYADEPRLQRTV